MKRWATLTVLLYLFTLSFLTFPMILTAFGGWGAHQGNGITAGQVLAFYQEESFWAWITIMGLGQALLLIVPIGIANERPIQRRPLLVSIVVCALFLAMLFFDVVLSILCVTLHDRAFDFIAFTGGLLKDAHEGPALTDYLAGTVLIIATLWLVWGLVFYHFARADDGQGLVKRATRWLLKGSILELLVAVPSHIIARNRHACCAPFGTFWGIATGLAIMLLCFGPGVFFLFVERFRRLKPPAN